jgi:ketosteroid isomerase-like protein
MRLCALLLLAILFQLPVALGADSGTAEAVTQAIACFPAAWNTRDMNAFGRCFAADADFVNVTTTWWRGRDAITKNHAYLLGAVDSTDTADVNLPPQAYGIFKGTTLALKPPTVRLLRPDVAIARANWQITGDSRTSQARSGFLMFVVVNNGPRWEIAAVQNTERNRPITPR